jgi:hypothetical protein
VAANESMVAAGVVRTTATISEAGRLVPPGPVQSNVYTYTPIVLSGPTVVPVLEAATVPPQPSLPLPPLAVQAVAPFVVHARTVD